MSDANKFVDGLKTYKKDQITEKMHKKLKKYTVDPNFKPEIMEKISAAGKGICMWLNAIDKYVDVMKVVKPKQVQLTKAEAQLKVAKDELSIKEASLQ